jgi:hypothetical protein
MRKYTFLAAGIFILLLSGCAVLSDSQVANINAFSVTASHYSNYPDEIFKKRAALHLDNELLEVLSFSDFNLLDRRVDKARANYNLAIAASDKFDLSIQIIQQYAGLLVELSSDKYTRGLDDNTTSLGNNLGILVSAYNTKLKPTDTIPAAISGELSNVIWALGRRVTRSKQAQALKKFIPLGNVLVASAVKNLVEVLDKDSITGIDGKMYPGLRTLLAEEKAETIQNYKNLVFTGRSPNTYASIRQYYDVKVDYDNTEALRQKCVTTANQLVKAHNALTNNITEKRDLKGLIKETQDLVTDFQDLGKIAGNWTSDIHIKL